MFIVQFNLPFMLIESLVQLQVIAPDSKIAKAIKIGKTKATETLNDNIYSEFKNSTSNLLENQPFSVIIDESTDISTKKCLAVIARFYNKAKFLVEDRYLGMVQLEKFDSKSIFDAIVNLLAKYNLPIKNLIGFAADNASVMMGVQSGVKARLLKENANLYSIGCISHSLHLCASSASKALPIAVEKLVRNVYNFFSNSCLRQIEFKELQLLFQTKVHKILKTSSTRWLALEDCVNRILEQWTPLYHYFIVDELDQNADIAHNIFRNLNDENKTYLHFLSYALGIVNKINKEFQSERPRVHIILKTLKSLYKTILSNYMTDAAINSVDLNSIDFTNPKNFLEVDNIYIGANAQNLILNSKSLSVENIREIKKSCRNYYIALCKEIVKRFDFENKILKAMEITDPQNLGPTLLPLMQLFPNLVKETNFQDIDGEWRQLRNLEIDMDKTDFEKFWAYVFQIKDATNELMFPHLKNFLSALIALPHGSAVVERLFSQLNLIKTKTRNCLSVETVDSIMAAKQLLADINFYDWIASPDLIKNYNKRINIEQVAVNEEN